MLAISLADIFFWSEILYQKKSQILGQRYVYLLRYYDLLQNLVLRDSKGVLNDKHFDFVNLRLDDVAVVGVEEKISPDSKQEGSKKDKKKDKK